MFIAMNRFKVALGSEDDFVTMWKSRDSYLDEVPGFRDFHLLHGPTDEECTLFISHSLWDSREAFEAWTHSDAFRKAHARAGQSNVKYLGHPQFEGFAVVI